MYSKSTISFTYFATQCGKLLQLERWKVIPVCTACTIYIVMPVFLTNTSIRGQTHIYGALISSKYYLLKLLCKVFLPPFRFPPDTNSTAMSWPFSHTLRVPTPCDFNRLVFIILGKSGRLFGASPYKLVWKRCATTLKNCCL